ncbi:MAG: hypothetical protein AB1751_03015 [Acidobacteriota bacterium]
MRAFTFWVVKTFDRFAHAWESTRWRRALGSFLVAVFLLALLAIELNRQGLLPQWGSDAMPKNHFYAVSLAFTFLLLVELVALVLSLATSVTASLGKQLEIFSLILLRNVFKEFTGFSEPVGWTQAAPSVVPMVADVLAAVLVFVVLGFFYRAQKHQPITEREEEQASFVASKKLIASTLLLLFAVIGVHHTWLYFTTGETYGYFEVMFTVLILSDVLLVLVSLRYSSTYRVVFRNSGFAATTVLLRLALVAPPLVNGALGLAAALLSLGVTLAYNAFTAPRPLEPGRPA